MNRSSLTKSLVPLALLLCSSACESVSSGVSGVGNFFESSFSGKKQDGLVRVDDLLVRIEQVHVETELSKEGVRESMRALRTLVAPDFGGDALESYGAFVKAIDASEKQAQALRKSVEPMEKTAEEVFAEWAKSLESFSSAEMRERSQLRLENTRERYEAIISAVEPALWAYDAMNRTLRDHALFLNHDFNAAAVTELEGEVDGLMKHASQLDKRFDATLKAAKRYIRSTALRGQVEGEGELEPEEIAPEQ